jgi:hypothetical protein
MSRYRVKSDGLNLRSEPLTVPRTRIATLRSGDVVRKIRVSSDPAWWEVEAGVGGQTVRGFVAHKYLVAETAHVPPVAHAGVHPAMLAENRPTVTRDSTGSAYAYPIGEPGRPGRTGNTPAERAKSVGAIVKWLGVDTRVRYKPVGTTTYCNIYAADFCYLAGVYLPRVWWTGKALERLARGEQVAAAYDTTVVELTANRLYEWLSDFGPEFGWTRTFDLTELQRRVNDGAVGIICAQRKDLNRPGHIAAVVPETAHQKAVRNATGVVTIPLQSQAGVSCYQYGCKAWWAADKYRAFGYWVHD